MEGPDDPAHRVGQIVADKYLLLGVLGSGGMGAVFEAEHKFTGRRVAVKLMHASLSRSQGLADRFVREARAPCTIGHKGIVDVLDGGRDDDGSLYLVLELLEGETLGEALRDDTLDVPQLCDAMVELLDALDAAHQAGFVHRDIKPDNIFLTRAGSAAAAAVKLLDFGVVGTLASALGAELTQTGAVVGTPLYMSPEQALGHKADARSDLWSVGAVMYRALAKKPPFMGDSYNAVIISVATGEYTPLAAVRPDLPAALVAVVDRALRKDPDKRWQRAADMAHALEHAMRDTDVDPHAPIDAHRGDTTAVERPSRRSPRDPVSQDADTVLAPGGPEARTQPRPTEPEVTPPSMTTVTEPESVAGIPVPPAALRRGAAAAAPPSLGWIWIAAIAIVLSAGAVSFALMKRQATGGQLASAASAPSAMAVPAAAEALDSRQHGKSDPAAAEPTAAEPVADGTREPREDEATPVPDEATPEPAKEETPSRAEPRGLSAQQLGEVVQSHQAELKRCLQEATVRARTAEASRLDVDLTVAASGSVSAVNVRGGGPDGLGSCVKDQVSRWRFPTTDAATDLSFPVLFEPSLVEL